VFRLQGVLTRFSDEEIQMTKFWQTLVLGMIFVAGTTSMAADSIYEFKMKDIEGKEVELSEFKDKVVLIVNVASKCGATPQYEQLQALSEKYKEKGLVVVGVPCNQFGGQEPGSEKDIKEFCSTKYKVTFPMMSKVDVNGEKEDPLYKFLKAHAESKENVKWNFEKFIISKEGKVVGRFGTKTKPDADEVVSVIESELKK
jgi:glutathione peroxidase